MKETEPLIIRDTQLPLPIELRGKHGEREYYLLIPAGNKFGACLNKVTAPLRRMFKQ